MMSDLPSKNGSHLLCFSTASFASRQSHCPRIGKVSGGVYSILFTVPKAKGGICPVLNIRALNVFTQMQIISIESIRLANASLHLGDLLTFVDIERAYLHILIFPVHQILQWAHRTTSLMLFSSVCSPHLGSLTVCRLLYLLCFIYRAFL